MKKLIIILGTVGVSFSAIFVRSSSAPSMVLVFYRVLFATLMLLPFIIIYFRKEILGLNIKSILLPVISGVFLGLHFTMYFESLSYTSIASSLILVDTEVFFVAAAMIVLMKEKISSKAWIGIIATFLGSVIVAVADIGSGSNMLLGDLMAFSGAAFMAVYTLLGKQCRKVMSTTVYTFLVYSSASITLVILTLIKGISLTGYENKNYYIAFGLAALCTLCGHSIYSWGLKYEKASFISTAKLLEPIFASVLGLIIFIEIPSGLVVLGGAIVIGGVYYYSRNSESTKPANMQKKISKSETR